MEKIVFPGIKKLYWLNSTQLEDSLMLKSKVNIVLAVHADINEIKFIAQPKITVEKIKKGGAYYEKSVLKFISKENLPSLHNVRFAFESTDGMQYLIGSRESKDPLIETIESTGSTSERAAKEYSISHIDLISLIPVTL